MGRPTDCSGGRKMPLVSLSSPSLILPNTLFAFGRSLRTAWVSGGAFPWPRRSDPHGSAPGSIPESGGTGSAATEATALLGDLRTFSLDSRTRAIRFLQPWVEQGLSPRQWQDLERVADFSLADFMSTARQIAEPQGVGYPFVVQASLGCELQPSGAARGFYDTAGNGQAIVSFDVAAGAWVAHSEDKLALYARGFLSWDRDAAARLQYFFRITCAYVLRAFAQRGNESLQRRERPVAVVFARAPPPADPLVLFLLVCRVSGFYPRPIRVAWLQDGEEVGPGRRLDSSGILPNADQTYQLRSSLAVGPGAGHRYACRVEHSSLGPRGLLIPWEHSRRWGPGLAVGITLGALAVAALAAVLVWRRRRGYRDVGQGQSRAAGESPGPSPDMGHGPSPGDIELRAGAGGGALAAGCDCRRWGLGQPQAPFVRQGKAPGPSWSFTATSSGAEWAQGGSCWGRRAAESGRAAPASVSLRALCQRWLREAAVGGAAAAQGGREVAVPESSPRRRALAEPCGPADRPWLVVQEGRVPVAARTGPLWPLLPAGADKGTPAGPEVPASLQAWEWPQQLQT
ncbi:antigen-presenting glycoprotein CD1d1-like [Carettochelys insculpta]|uniref:antigen-presenting glycoprotein CD1d1-like n=1 Tax=Carettochelys insculpta TaxID=44489 RepID=UPI003EB96D95